MARGDVSDEHWEIVGALLPSERGRGCRPSHDNRRSVTLDIYDTCDVVHGRQQLSLFNTHYDEYCFLPIHVYDTATGRPVAMALRPGKTPSGVDVRVHIRRLVRRIRTKWPTTRLTIRGDGHYVSRKPWTSARPTASTTSSV